MQPRPRRVFLDGGAVFAQGLRQLASQLELASRELADSSGFRGQALEIRESALGQLAHNLARLESDFGTAMRLERAIHFRQRLWDAAQLDKRPSEIQARRCVR